MPLIPKESLLGAAAAHTQLPSRLPLPVRSTNASLVARTTLLGIHGSQSGELALLIGTPRRPEEVTVARA